jgi:hypothetical protein
MGKSPGGETLLNRFSREELPKMFDVNGRWKDGTGSHFVAAMN